MSGNFPADSRTLARAATTAAAVLLLAAACSRPEASAPVTAADSTAAGAPAVPISAAPAASASAAQPATVAASPAVTDWAADREFEPGKHLGAVTQATNEAALKSLYGDQVKRRDWEGAEGETMPATVVFPDSADEFWVLWKDGAFETPERIMIVGGNWHTAEGLHVGTPLPALRKLNGGNFEFTGFDWDYGGVVTSWRKGKLERYAGILGVSLDREPVEGEREDRAIEGDTTVSSDHPGLDARGVKVARLDIGF